MRDAIVALGMTEDQLRALLTDVQSGATDVDTALERVRHLPFEDMGFAKVDKRT